MIEIDGSQGEGGGQIIRSSLALSAATGTPIILTNIRAGRQKPGLKRQHVTCVNAAAEICGASVNGAEMNASTFTFEPDQVQAGDYHFQVSTAGSAALVAQTVIPPLMILDQPSVLTVEGGTHNPWAPPFDFLQQTFFPQLAKAGPKVKAELESYGFYPAGGGRFSLSIEPASELKGIELIERGGKRPQPKVTAVVSKLPRNVGERECETIRKKSNWNASCFNVVEVEEPVGPGNVVMIELQSENVTELFIGIGKVGVRAEQVARSVLRDARAYLASDVPVGEYLADQLMMPMGLAAHQGKTSLFKTGPLSMHSQTHIDILKVFLNIDVEVEEQEGDTFQVTFRPTKS